MNLDELDQALRDVNVIAYDTETTGLDWREKVACGYVITLGHGNTHYFPVRHASGPNLDPVQVESLLAQRLSRPNLHTIMHNAAFDLKFAAKHGIHFGGPVSCTQTLAALCDEHSPAFSLDALSREYHCESVKQTNIYDYMASYFNEPKADKSLMSRYWELPADDPVGVAYACADGDTTLELYDKLCAEVNKQDLHRVWDVERALTPVLHEMSWRGLKIDEEELDKIYLEAMQQRDAALDALPPNLNPKSPLQMAKLFTDAKVLGWPKTVTGRDSFPEAWLILSELGRTVVAARKWSTLLSSFIEPIKTKHLFNGRIHTNFNQLRADEFGTISGRISANDPNILNFPSPKRQPEQGKMIRRIFVADDGMEMAEADYNQCEPRLVAHYAKIPSWITGYNATPPLDSHTAVSKTTGLPRQRAKTINMALITGAGQDKLISMLGLPYEEGLRTLQTYHAGVPQIKNFQRQAKDVFLSRGYVKSLLGRRFRLEDSRYAYRALSRIIQGSNADIVKLALVKMHALSKSNGAQLLNSIYDSVIWQAEKTQWVDQVHASMCDTMCMIDEFKLLVPMAVDFGRGHRWSECSSE